MVKLGGFDSLHSPQKTHTMTHKNENRYQVLAIPEPPHEPYLLYNGEKMTKERAEIMAEYRNNFEPTVAGIPHTYEVIEAMYLTEK